MAFANLFPYTNRALSLSSSLTEKAKKMCPHRLAQIALANMKVGDSFLLFGGLCTVESCDDQAIAFNNGHTITIEQLNDHPWVEMLGEHLMSLAPAYTDPLVQIIERDPAVFRLQTGLGWVINDALCKMTGNVLYAVGNLRKAVPVSHPNAKKQTLDVAVSAATPQENAAPKGAEGQMSLF